MKDDKGWSTGTQCYASHEPLTLPGPEQLIIHGGSCSSPVVKDADVYIGFCTSMRLTSRHWPWRTGEELLYSITDCKAPYNPESFKELVDWTLSKLKEGRKVHCGCIGGHGRTGLFLSALVARCGEADAIRYVRKHYCSKAVESEVQVAFLHKHFGIELAKPSKAPFSSKSKNGGMWDVSSRKSYRGSDDAWSLPSVARKAPAPEVDNYDWNPERTRLDGSYEPVSGLSVWGD